jgi:type II secretory pathway pseudopilin PulG
MLTVFALILLSAVTVVAKSKDEKQAEARTKAAATLERLYKRVHRREAPFRVRLATPSSITEA